MPAALLERMPTGVDPGREHGAGRIHRGLVAPVHPDTPWDPISRSDITSKKAATTKLKRNNRHKRIKWEKDILNPEGEGSLSKM